VPRFCNVADPATIERLLHRSDLEPEQKSRAGMPAASIRLSVRETSSTAIDPVGD